MGHADPRSRYDDLIEFAVEERVRPTEFAEAKGSEPARIGWVALGMVFDRAGRSLWIQQPWADGWLLPGGVPKPEEPLRDAVVREVQEETGVEVEPVRPHAVEELTFAERETGETVGWTAVFFETEAITTALKTDPGLADEPITDVRWFEERPDQIYNPDVMDRVLNRCEPDRQSV